MPYEEYVSWAAFYNLEREAMDEASGVVPEPTPEQKAKQQLAYLEGLQIAAARKKQREALKANGRYPRH